MPINQNIKKSNIYYYRMINDFLHYIYVIILYQNIYLIMKYYSKFLIFLLLLFFVSCDKNQTDKVNKKETILQDLYYRDSAPLIRWWWHASEFKKKDIDHQLNWLKKNGFGGVEIAWIYPVDRDTAHKKIKWLGSQWQELTKYTKQKCMELGLSCDFTFGTLWPFGGTFLPDKYATNIYGDTSFRQPLRLSWEHPDTGNVLDHLDSSAFDFYSKYMGNALKPAMDGDKSALFCDSWEVETRRIWTDGFAELFANTYGYDLQKFMDSIYNPDYAEIYYDYMRLVGKLVIQNFYVPFTEYAKANNAFSRVQCAGSPTDLISSYSRVDVPETEAMLYEPYFAQIPASAALLSGNTEVSSETFTCLYGFPDKYFGEEQVADMKLVADALFGYGVNQIVWHGMPYNPEDTDSIDFYATVDVGPDADFAGELKDFNDYMQKISQIMKKGKPLTNTAVYLPYEDALYAQEYPEDKQMPWSWGAYEMRYIDFPEETKGYSPHWINEEFLNKAVVENGIIKTENASFDALYVDVNHMNMKALRNITGLARQGAPVCMNKRPKQAGRFKTRQFFDSLSVLYDFDNVGEAINKVFKKKPLIEADEIPVYKAREVNGDIYIFFAHPFAKQLSLPLGYGESFSDEILKRNITINTNGASQNLRLEFEPYQSILIKIDENNHVSFADIEYVPPVPLKEKENAQ